MMTQKNEIINDKIDSIDMTGNTLAGRDGNIIDKLIKSWY